MINFLSLIVIVGSLLLAGCGEKCCDHKHDTHAHEKTEQATKPTEPAHTAHNSETLAIKTIASKNDFEQLVLKSEKPVIVDFTAKWCGACQVMKPVFEELASELGSQYTFVSLDVDKAEDVSQEQNIIGIPAFLLFKNGKEVNTSNRMVGVVSKDEFKKNLEQSFK